MKAHAAGRDPDERARDAHDSPELPNLQEIYRRYASFVWRWVRRMGVPEAAVEDVMHEVFLVVHRRREEYDGRAAMTTWLFHITRGVASNYKRGRAREGRRLQRIEVDLETDPRPTRAPDPEEHTHREQAAAFVRTFLGELEPGKRRLFELVDIDGLSVPEAAEICRINLNTAYSRLRAGRREFQAAIDRLRTSRGGGSGP